MQLRALRALAQVPLDVTVPSDSFVCPVTPFGAFFFLSARLFGVIVLLQYCVFFLGVIMTLSMGEKAMLLTSLETEMARLRRAINSEVNDRIKVLMRESLAEHLALRSRVEAEVAK